MPKRIRTKQIIIDLPKEDAITWVMAVFQRVIKDSDGEVIQVIDDIGRINKPLKDFMLDMVSITDPVTKQALNISSAGVAEAIRIIILNWMNEKYDGSVIDGVFIEN